jgi:hypothetical protein
MQSILMFKRTLLLFSTGPYEGESGEKKQHNLRDGAISDFRHTYILRSALHEQTGGEEKERGMERGNST